MAGTKRNDHTISVGMRGWMYRMLGVIAEREDVPMTVIMRSALEKTYPDDVRKFRKVGSEKPDVSGNDDLDLDFDLDDDLDFDDGLAGKTFDPADIDQEDIDGEFEGIENDEK